MFDTYYCIPPHGIQRLYVPLKAHELMLPVYVISREDKIIMIPQ